MIKRLDGTPTKMGEILTVDHNVTEFKVVIRSMSNLSEGEVKRLLQQKYEVVSIEKVNQDTYVHGPLVSDDDKSLFETVIQKYNG